MPETPAEIPEFKRGDKGGDNILTGTVNADLAECVPPNGGVRFLAKPTTDLAKDPIVLVCEVTETGTTSTVEHTMDGTLAAALYVAEIEASRSAMDVRTFPNRSKKVYFRVVQDLG